ncbi:MAG: hypothetical protein ACKO5K_07235 [Armatimonadota bacterium]
MVVRAKAPVRIDFGGAWTDVDRYALTRGGVVFNATIAHHVEGSFQIHESGDGAESREGLDVRYGFDLPSGSGLGTSAALNVVWFGLLNRRVETDADRIRVAEQAYGLEGLLGILGGRQDQYASAMGGFNLMRFDESVHVERVPIPAATIKDLEQRSVLAYTGKPRLSGAIHENVWGAFDAGRASTVHALDRLREIGEAMPATLESGNIESFATLLAENWTCQRRLDDSVTNPDIERFFASAIEAGALGGKACGAGGGGCLYFVTKPGRQAAVSDALAAAGAQVIPFEFAMDGLTVTREA